MNTARTPDVSADDAEHQAPGGPQPHDYDLSQLREIAVRGLKFCIMPRYTYHFVDHDYENFSLDLFLGCITRQSLVVDVGAHYGIYSLLAARARARVVAFEPVPENLEVLHRNMALNQLSVETHSIAVSDHDGIDPFNIAWASDSACFGTHPNAEPIATIDVTTRRLDSVLAGARIDVLKIDTEGHELAVLRGAAASLAASPDISLFVELNPSCLQSAGEEPRQLLRALRDLGLRPFVIHEDNRVLTRIGDALEWKDHMEDRAYVNLLCVAESRERDVAELASDVGAARRPLYSVAAAARATAGKLKSHAVVRARKVTRRDLPSFAHDALMRGIALRHWDRLAPVWDRAWARAEAMWGARPVRTTLHGVPAILNFNHPYPLWSRRWPGFNDPIVEAAMAAADMLSRAVTFLDVGANIGDTALLLASSAPEVLGRLIAVEADPEFLQYLEPNLTALSCPTEIWKVYLSRDGNQVGSAVRTHAGTAALHGPSPIPSRRLDDVWTEQGEPFIDVLKTDTDGYDGQVIAGARRLISASRPVVVFEWAPVSFDTTANDPHEPFVVLSGLGYDRYVWFDKYGAFDHIEVGYSSGTVEAQAELCRRSKALLYWHYDLIALHAEHSLSGIDVADLRRAFARKVPVHKGVRRARPLHR